MNPQPNPGETIKFRLAFAMPKGVDLKSLTLRDKQSVPIVIDLSSYTAQSPRPNTTRSMEI